ncbi:MAG: glycerophosphodiester phosphodiesterase, partial [Flavobacteriales bacterium]|nr:glycerophosphodiester phosphodiesterase [Flavobacteriales bacterium]
IQSFDPRTLHYVKDQYPTIAIALLIENEIDFESNIEAFGSIPNIYSPNYFLVNKELIDFAKDNGMKVIPWTANDRGTMGALIQLGVDGVITDYPDQLVDIVRIRDANR